MVLAVGLCGSSPLGHAEKNPLRDVFFGETHIHTSWSFDAYVFGNTLAGPEEAYQYALGKPIRHPGGYMVQIKRPLDFQAVTDHAEYMGTVRLANDPQSDLSKLPIAEKLRVRSKEDIQKIYLFLGTTIAQERADQGAGQPRSRRLASGSRSSRSPTSTTSPVSSRPSPPTNGPRRRTIAICIGTSSSRIRRRCRRCRSPRWTRPTRRTCGTGWMASAKRGTSCWRSRITRTSPTVSCSRWKSTARAGPSTRRGRKRG